jgi:PKD repeat protein
MNRVLIALTLTLVLPHVAYAQQSGGRIAYDYCDYVYWFEDDYWVIVYTCNVYAADIGGSHVWLGEGFDPALSPDGTRIAFVVGAAAPGSFEPSDIIVVDLRDRTYSNVTANDAAPASSPAWSWDGRLAFESSRSGSLELYAINADGTGLAQLTNGVGFRGHPTWSPDGRIAFECTGETGEQNLCSINSDGTGFRRLTGPGGDDSEPAFSPDGTRIAFVTNRFASPNGLAILNADGTITPLANGAGNAPTWSPDGRQLAFSLPDSVEGGFACNADGPCLIHAYAAVYAIDLATEEVSVLSGGANPSWAQSPPGGFQPEAAFTVACTLLTCTFDASPSSDDGTIASYTWRFDDGTLQTGITALHTYPRGGSYTVELLVVDDYGLRDTGTRTFDVTDSPPVASFTRDCSGLICRFDASGSSDSDGQVVAYAWNFGDGTMATTFDTVVIHSYPPGTYTVRLTVSDNVGATGTVIHEIAVVNNPPVAAFEFSCDASGPVCLFDSRGWDSDGVIVSHAWQFGDGTSGVGGYVTHTYAAAGTYSVMLTVTDNYGATNSHTASVTVVKVVLHVGDLDGATDIQRRYWTAFVSIRVHDAEHRPVGARVDGVWSSGESGSCTIDSNGTCTLATVVATSVASVTFTVHSVSLGSAVYDPTRNHDVDGETNGTSITITRK